MASLCARERSLRPEPRESRVGAAGMSAGTAGAVTTLCRRLHAAVRCVCLAECPLPLLPFAPSNTLLRGTYYCPAGSSRRSTVLRMSMTRSPSQADIGALKTFTKLDEQARLAADTIREARETGSHRAFGEIVKRVDSFSWSVTVPCLSLTRACYFSGHLQSPRRSVSCVVCLCTLGLNWRMHRHRL